MKILYLATLVGLCVAKVDYSGHQVYRATPDDVQMKAMRRLTDRLQLDIWSEARFHGDTFDFRVPPELRLEIDNFLARNSIQHEVMIEDVQYLIDNEKEFPCVTEYSCYRPLSEIKDWMSNFATNTAYVSLKDIGLSYEGRSIQALSISDGVNSNRAFVISCGIHSREWVTTAACRQITAWLAEEYVGGEGIDFHIIPVANPDGYEYTWIHDRMWRKTRRDNQNSVCYGVDPNRNYDVAWSGPGASDMPCSDSYYGPSPLSENETMAQVDFVQELGNVNAYIDIHAYSQLWMFPYGYTFKHAEDYDLLNNIGLDSVNAINSVHGMEYTSGPISEVIYVASGSSADYFYDKQKVKCSFAAELRDTGKYGFLLPDDQILPTAEETYAGLMVITENIANGQCEPNKE